MGGRGSLVSTRKVSQDLLIKEESFYQEMPEEKHII